MHPFRWVPAEGERHASLEPSTGQGYPEGKVIQALCGKRVRAENSDISWLWETCPDCNNRAHELAHAGARAALVG